MGINEYLNNDVDRVIDPFTPNKEHCNPIKSTKSPFLRQMVACSSIIINGISMGMTYGFMGTLLPQLPNFDVNSASWLTSSLVLLAPIGILLSSFIMRKCGRKFAEMMVSVSGSIGWVSLIISDNIYVLSFGCSILGISSGFITVLLNVYVTEISEPKYRGLISLIASSIITFGIFLSHVLGVICHWKVALGLSTLVPVISLILVFFMVETPSWLMLNERYEEAEKIFYKLRRCTHENQQELKEMLNRKFQNKSEKKKFILRQMASRKFLKPFFILTFIFITLIGSGYDIIMFYAVYMLRNMELINKTWMYLILLDLVRLFACIISCYLVKILNRRFLFLTSAIATFVSIILMILCVVLKLPEYVTFACLCLYLWSIYAGLNPIPWLMTTELYPEIIRDMGTAMTMIWSHILIFAVVKSGPLLINQFGIVFALTTFALIVFSCILILYFIMPETKNSTLQEIENNIVN